MGIAGHRHPHDRSRRLRATPLLPWIVPAAARGIRARAAREQIVDAGVCRGRATARRLGGVSDLHSH